MSTNTQPSITIVTGGSRGLGRNTAVSLAKKGSGVILTYVANKAAADGAVAEISALGQKAVALRLDCGDLSAFPAFAAAVKAALSDTWGAERFTSLVNNAGIGKPTPIGNTDEAVLDELVDVHFKGVYFLTQTLLPLMADGGRIVNLSSGLARFSRPGFAVYASMKGAIEVLTRYLALELGSRGITVNTVAPGPIETDFAGGMIRDNAAVNKITADGSPLGRVGVPDDIGPMIAALLSDDNRWVTGQRIEVSGGYSS